MEVLKKQCLRHESNDHEILIDFDAFMKCLNGNSSEEEEEEEEEKKEEMILESPPIKTCVDVTSLNHIPGFKISCLNYIITGSLSNIERTVCDVTARMGFTQIGPSGIDASLYNTPIFDFGGIPSTSANSKSKCARRNIDLCDGVIVFQTKSSMFLNNVVNYAYFGQWNRKSKRSATFKSKHVLIISQSVDRSFNRADDQLQYPSKWWIDDNIRIYEFLLHHNISKLYITGNNNSMDATWQRRITNFLLFTLDRFKPTFQSIPSDSAILRTTK